jgi:hypothetical protein
VTFARRCTYTTVTLITPADWFTDDLWFSSGRPFGVAYAQAVTNLLSRHLVTIVALVAMVLLLSYLGGGLASVVLF